MPSLLSATVQPSHQCRLYDANSHELLREIVPDLRRLAIMADVGNPAGVVQMSEAVAAAGTLGLDTVRLEIPRAEDIVPAFDSLKGRVGELELEALAHHTGQEALHRVLVPARDRFRLGLFMMRFRPRPEGRSARKPKQIQAAWG